MKVETKVETKVARLVHMKDESMAETSEKWLVGQLANLPAVPMADE